MPDFARDFALGANAVTNIYEQRDRSRRTDLFADELKQRMAFALQEQPYSIATMNEKLKDMQAARAASEQNLDQAKKEAARAEEAYQKVGKPFVDYIGGEIQKYLNPQADVGAPTTTVAQLLNAGVPASVVGMAAGAAGRGNIPGFMSPDIGVDLGAMLAQRRQAQVVGNLLGGRASAASGAVNAGPSSLVSGATRAGEAVANVLGNPISSAYSGLDALMGLRIPGVDNAIDAYGAAERGFMSPIMGAGTYDVLTKLLGGGYAEDAGAAIRDRFKGPVEDFFSSLGAGADALESIPGLQEGTAEEKRAAAIRLLSGQLYEGMEWDPVTRRMVKKK